MSEYSAEEYAERLDAELATQRMRREARRILDAEERPPAELPEILTLRERLARPRQPVTYRIEGWQPAGSRVVLVAQFKAGKTTLVGNLARVLVDGGLFLGRDPTHPIPGTVALLDFEMSAAQFDTWLAEQKIINDDRVVVLPLRGAAGAFDILDPDRRAEWAKLLADQDVSYLVLDCLRPVLDALGLDEHHDAGRFLTAFDALMADASIAEACIVHHMGHYAERSRGDSRIRDWPDVEWRLVRQDDNPASPRYIAAYGRDVDQPEAQLHHDPTTRRLTVRGGNRHEAGTQNALDAVVALLREAPGQHGKQIETALMARGLTQKAVREALALGTQPGGPLIRYSGTGTAILHRLAESSQDGNGADPTRPVLLDQNYRPKLDSSQVTGLARWVVDLPHVHNGRSEKRLNEHVSAGHEVSSLARCDPLTGSHQLVTTIGSDEVVTTSQAREINELDQSEPQPTGHPARRGGGEVKGEEPAGEINSAGQPERTNKIPPAAKSRGRSSATVPTPPPNLTPEQAEAFARLISAEPWRPAA
jgi:hypothetical protein